MTGRVRRRPDVLWRRSLETVVLLPAGADDVLTLAGTGPTVWELLGEWRSEGELASLLAAAFHANEARVAADLGPVLAQLEAVGALEATADSGDPDPE